MRTLALAVVVAAGCSTSMPQQEPPPGGDASCTGATLTSPSGVAQTAGMPIVLQATSTGCPTEAEYAFYETAPDGVATLIQAYSPASAFTFASAITTPGGSYEFRVDVRDRTSRKGADASASLAIALAPSPENDPFTQLAAMPGVCTQGWCWQWPTPSGNDFRGIAATDANNVWITGWDLVLQWNGTSWVEHHPPVPDHIQPSQAAFALSGTSASNMHVLYGPNVEWWNGRTWTLAEAGNLNGNPDYDNLFVAPDTGDAYVTLSNSVIEQFHQGARVKTYQAGCGGCFLGSIFGTSSHDIFVTTIGANYHWDGNLKWTQITSQTLGGYMGGSNDVWLTDGGTVGHWDGSAFATVDMPAGYSWRPSQYNAPDDMWWYSSTASGQTMIHYDGSSYDFHPVTVSDGTGFTPSSGGRLAHGDVWWLGGDLSTLYISTDDHTLTPVLPFRPDLSGFGGMWGSRPSNMYYAAGGNLLHFDGQGVTTFATVASLMAPDPAPVYGQISGLVGVAGAGSGGADELFAWAGVETTPGVFENVVFHDDGQLWTHAVIDGDFGVPFLVGPGEMWLLSASGTSHHYVDGAWTDVATTPMPQPFTSLWQQDASHVWIVGNNRTLASWDPANPSAFAPIGVPPSQCQTDLVMQFGQIFGIAGQPWIPSGEACMGVDAMWELGSSATSDGSAQWTEVTTQVLGDGSIFHQNPRSEAPGPYGKLAYISDRDVIYSNAGDNSTWRWDGSVWQNEDNGGQWDTPFVFATPDGTSFTAPQGGYSTGVLVHAPK